MEIKARIQKGSITYPMSAPSVNVTPARTGPPAFPNADVEVATPFNVPSKRKLLAELVRRIVVQGKPKTPDMPLMSMMQSANAWRDVDVGRRTVKGVRR